MYRLTWFTHMTGVCVLVAWTGCDAFNGSQTKLHDPDAAIAYPQITMFEGLEGQLLFGPPQIKRGTYQPISVAIPVRTARDHPQRVQYRFEYFDGSGRPLRPSMDWRYILLPVDGERTMAGSALDIAAVDWRLEVRRAR